MSSVQIQPPHPAGNPKTAVMGPKFPKGPGAPKKAGQGRPLPSPSNNPQTTGPKTPGSTPPIQIQVPAGNQKINSRSAPNSPHSIVGGNIAKIESRSAAVSPATSPRNNEVSDIGSPRMRPKPLPKAPRRNAQADTDLEATISSPRSGPSSSPIPIISTTSHVNTPPMTISPPPIRVAVPQEVEASTSPKLNPSAVAMLLAAEQATGVKMTGYRTRIVDELIKKSRRSIYANDELVKGDAHEDQKKRCLTVTEIIESEKFFLKNMTSAIEHYYNPSKNGESPVPENKVKMMFNNLDQIIEYSTDLLQTMFDKIPNDFDASVGVGNIFVQFVPRFNVFDEYAKLHYQAIKTFGQLERKKEVVQYWKELRERTPGLLDIMALLIMPVQRFLRHKLLLEELLKRTPEGHPDHEDVVKAIGAIDQFAQSVNENVKRHTALQKYNEIERKFGFPKELELPEGSEDIRVFIKEGTLMKVCRKEPKPRYFVLFEDLLLYGESGVLSYSLHRCLDLSKTSIKDVEDTPAMENSFEVYSTGKSFVVFADTIGEKKSWLNSFKQVKLLAANDNQAAIWVNDKMSKCCLKCGREFKAHFRRHHCRACGLLVCSKCSPKTAIVPSVSATSKQRVCNGCFDLIANGITPKKASAHNPDNDLSSEDDDSSSEDDGQKLSRSQTSPSLNASGGNKSNNTSPDVSRAVKSPETHKRSNTTVPPNNGQVNGNNDNVKKKSTFANLFTTLRGGGKKKEGDQ